MACCSSGNDNIKKISEIWNRYVCSLSDRCADKQCLSEALDRPPTPMLAIERVAVSRKSVRLFLSVRPHAVVSDRRVCADCGKSQVWLGCYPSGGTDRLLTVISLCAFSIGRAGVGGDRDCYRNDFCFDYKKNSQRRKNQIKIDKYRAVTDSTPLRLTNYVKLKIKAHPE